MFVYSRFIENPSIWSWETNPCFFKGGYVTLGRCGDELDAKMDSRENTWGGNSFYRVVEGGSRSEGGRRPVAQWSSMSRVLEGKMAWMGDGATLSWWWKGRGVVFNLKREGDGWRCVVRRWPGRTAAAIVARWETTSVVGRLGRKPKRLRPAVRVSKEKWSGLTSWVGPKMRKAPGGILSNFLKINGFKIQRFKIFLNWIWTGEN
jgi:hypothetical protein